MVNYWYDFQNDCFWSWNSLPVPGWDLTFQLMHPYPWWISNKVRWYVNPPGQEIHWVVTCFLVVVENCIRTMSNVSVLQCYIASKLTNWCNCQISTWYCLKSKGRNKNNDKKVSIKKYQQFSLRHLLNYQIINKSPGMIYSFPNIM